ncbi:hypothetical protein BHM03_00047053 [Ensete ventricosum]|nr:hypothetical protein BHM03_00047053 [Ensete ventricosum]
MCTSSPVVVSVERRWSTVEWREPSGPAREVGDWLVGSRVRKRGLSSGRSFVPEIFTASKGYHAIVLLHTVHGPWGEKCVLPVVAVACRPYPSERANSGTNLGDLIERANSGMNLGDLAERANSDTNLDDLAERMNSGTNLSDSIERVNSGTNLGDLAERANSGTNLGDLAKRVNSGTNLSDSAERANSGTNLGDLVERVNSGTNFSDSTERANLGTNLGDLAKRVNSDTNLGDLAERANSGTNLGVEQQCFPYCCSGIPCKSFYGGCYRSFVPEIFTASKGYHAVVLLHTVHGLWGEVCVLLAVAVAWRPYPCQVSRTVAGFPMLVSSRLHRVKSTTLEI